MNLHPSTSLVFSGYQSPDGSVTLLEAKETRSAPWRPKITGSLQLEITDQNGNLLHSRWVTPEPWGLPGQSDDDPNILHRWATRMPYFGKDSILLVRDKGGVILLEAPLKDHIQPLDAIE